MKKTEIIKSIVETMAENTYAEKFEELQWLFEQYSIAAFEESKNNVE